MMLLCLDRFYKGKLITVEGFSNNTYKFMNKQRDTAIAEGIRYNPLAQLFNPIVNWIFNKSNIETPIINNRNKNNNNIYMDKEFVPNFKQIQKHYTDYFYDDEQKQQKGQFNESSGMQSRINRKRQLGYLIDQANPINILNLYEIKETGGSSTFMAEPRDRDRSGMIFEIENKQQFQTNGKYAASVPENVTINRVFPGTYTFNKISNNDMLYY